MVRAVFHKHEAYYDLDPLFGNLSGQLHLLLGSVAIGAGQRALPQGRPGSIQTQQARYPQLESVAALVGMQTHPRLLAGPPDGSGVTARGIGPAQAMHEQPALGTHAGQPGLEERLALAAQGNEAFLAAPGVLVLDGPINPYHPTAVDLRLPQRAHFRRTQPGPPL